MTHSGHRVYVWVLYGSQNEHWQFLYTAFNLLDFITKTQCVYSTIWTESLNIIQVNHTWNIARRVQTGQLLSSEQTVKCKNIGTSHTILCDQQNTTAVLKSHNKIKPSTGYFKSGNTCLGLVHNGKANTPVSTPYKIKKYIKNYFAKVMDCHVNNGHCGPE